MQTLLHLADAVTWLSHGLPLVGLPSIAAVALLQGPTPEPHREHRGTLVQQNLAWGEQVKVRHSPHIACSVSVQAALRMLCP